MTAGELGCLVAGMIFGMLGVILYLMPQLGNSGRSGGSHLNGREPGTTGSATTDFSGMAVGYEVNGGTGDTDTDAVNGEMRDG